MYTAIILVRYRPILAYFGFLTMLIFRISLYFNTKIKDYKLLGSAKQGQFDNSVDWCQWGLFGTFSSHEAMNKFLTHSFYMKWVNFFGKSTWHIAMQPTQCRGVWNGKAILGDNFAVQETNKPIAVLTRARVKPRHLPKFWKASKPINDVLYSSPGLITSIGVGELPFFGPITFSIWENAEAIDNFAQKSRSHGGVIKQVNDEAWFYESLFVRFNILNASGNLETLFKVSRKY